MKVNQMIPEKVTMCYVELNKLDNKYYNTYFCFFTDSKSTSAAKSRIGENLLYISKSYREDNSTINTMLLSNTKFRIELTEEFSQIYDAYIKNFLIPVRLIHKDLPANKIFLGLFPKSSILDLISSVGNLSNRLVLGNVCINLDVDFNSRFFNLVHENPTNKDFTLSRSIGNLRELNGNTTKWIPGNVYYLPNKRNFYLYLGKYEYDCCSSNYNSNVNIITPSNTTLVNYYNNLDLIEKPDIYISYYSIVNLEKNQDFGEFIKNNFLNYLESGNVLIKSKDSPKLSAINCGNYLVNADPSQFNLSFYIKNLTKKKILSSFNNDFKNLSRLFSGLFTFNPDLFNEDKNILTSYLETKAVLWREHFLYYSGSNTFSEFFNNHKSNVEFLLIKPSWIKLLSMKERYKICEKIYDKTK